MESLLKPVFSLLSVPDVKIRRPWWLAMPSANQTLFMILVSYFLVTGGVIYDVIVEPPSMGSTTDEHGHSRPVAFMQASTVSQNFSLYVLLPTIQYFNTNI